MINVIPELTNLRTGSLIHGDKLSADICQAAIAEIKQLNEKGEVLHAEHRATLSQIERLKKKIGHCNLMAKSKYRKKPVVIEAVQYTEYGRVVLGMCNSVSCCGRGGDYACPHVHTIHADQILRLEVGDWVLPEPDGEHFYPCKPDIFEATYEKVDLE